MKHKTVGQYAAELSQQDHAPTDATEQERLRHKEYEENFLECLRRGKELYPQQNFFINVINKKERILHNTYRNYFVPKASCPTPDYDQNVYKYHYEDDRLELIWVIPDRFTCAFVLKNKHTLPEDQKELIQYVIDFKYGKLMDKCLELNNEIIIG